ncbi:hypothetical protein FB451DRAFT_1230943 [Mycena latifolia]|nr:hypothetical protein FB451DRAFT_1230943 [Mycena latifolia]
MSDASIPELNPLIPLPENLLRLARADPARQLGFIVNEALPNAQPVFSQITWRHALLDIRQRAEELVAASGWPARNIGEPNFVVGLLLRNGYSYFLTLTAVVMLRWTPIVLSPRNSPSGTIHLMKSAQSTRLIVDSDLLSFAENLNEPSFHIVKTVDEVTPQDGTTDDSRDLWADYPTGSPETLAVEARTGIFAFKHTSGSTGHPKLIPETHQFLLNICSAIRRQRPQSMHCTYYTVMPLFHSVGVLLTYVFAVGLVGRVHFINLRQPPTSGVVLRHLTLHGERGLEILLPPSMLEEIVDGELREEGLMILKRASILLTSGAPLRKDVGDVLRNNDVRLQSLMGMSETGPLSAISLSKEPGDWQYITLNEMYKYFFKPIDAEGTAKEMIVLPNENSPCVINHRNPDGLATGDLWEQHPDPAKSHLWTIKGRMGDVTVLNNGEKTDNKQLENLLCTSPLIKAAVIFGSGRFLNGAIIWPSAPLGSDEPDVVAAYLDTVWPHITENVNTIIPQHSRLIRPLVLVGTPTKPFVLTDKHSINRKLSLNHFVDEIEAAYRRVEEDGYEEVALPTGGLPLHDSEAVTSYVEAVVHKVLQRRVALDEDLFDAGLESLLAMRIRSSMLAALKKSGKNVSVPQNIVYTLPTQRGLARYLQDALSSSETSMNDQSSADFDIGATIAHTIDKYTVDFPEHRPAMDDRNLDGGAVYAVTGSTGSLGSFFVSLLLNKPEVAKIYLLNRKTDAGSIEKRHEAAFRSRGLDYGLLTRAVSEGRVVHLEVSLGENNLGLNRGIYDAMRAELTHIVHCAWLLNFNLILPSFKTHVQGVRNLVDLALGSPLPSPPHITFLSSVAVVAGWPGSAPEASMETPAACLDQGYAHSKYVAEKIIERAVAGRPSLKATIIRSGQISGAEGTGAWSSKEHIPILFKSCRDFGLVPDGLPTVRWLPVNVAAQVLYKEIQFSSAPLEFYNLENSIATPWSLVASTLSKMYDLPVVPAAQWLEHVRMRPENPANKLLAFFEEYSRGAGMPALQLHHARDAAGDMVDYVVDEDLIKVYARRACE